MMAARALLRDSGSASVEFALILPMLLVLLFGGIEAGHFVWTQHKLAEAVRDGARYAARVPIRMYCDGASPQSGPEFDAWETNVKLLTRTGQISSTSAISKVPGWSADQVTVNPGCNDPDSVNTGLYAEYAAEFDGAKGPRVEVTATNVPYPWMFGALGAMMSGIAPNVRLSASSISPGIGL